MKKKILALILALALVLPLCPVFELPLMTTPVYASDVKNETPEFAGGTGTKSNPYLIEKKEHLNNVRNHLDAHFKMIADIVFTEEDFAEGGDFYNNGNGWEPIGQDALFKFTGVLDGNNFSIANLVITANETSSRYYGLFSENNGIIRNLSLKNANISVVNTTEIPYVGGIAGNLGSYYVNSKPVPSKIENCNFYGTIQVSSNDFLNHAGGIVGIVSSENSIVNCHNYGSVTAECDAGGICASNGGTISYCSNKGTVAIAENNSTYTKYIGGICSSNSGIIEYCYNEGNIVKNAFYVYMGGIAGENRDLITDCYNAAAISGDSLGGIVGSATYGTTQRCYNAGTLDGRAAGGIVYSVYSSSVKNCYYLYGGGLGASINSSSLQKQESLSYLDFNEVWEFVEGNLYKYPTLKNNPHYIISDGNFQGGLGTEADPYLITTKNHLNNVRNHLDAHYKMIADIVFTEADFAEGGAFYNNGDGWEPVGANEQNSFNGVFDGNNCTISKLKINTSVTMQSETRGVKYAGLFAYSKGSIKNLSIKDSLYTIQVNGSSYGDLYTGGIVGYQNKGEIINCSFAGNITTTTTAKYILYTGGIVGYIRATNISSCANKGHTFTSASNPHYTGSVNPSYTGGICGEAINSTTIVDCCNEGLVEGGENTGGIVGYTAYSVSIANCANTGDTRGIYCVGGICGYLSTGEITKSYNTGDIQSNNPITANSTDAYSQAGGICGWVYQASISDCYNIGKIDSRAARSLTTSTSYARAGGIVGITSGTIENSYNVGKIESDNYAAGICGNINSSNGGSLVNCYYIDTCQRGVYGVTDKTTKCTSNQMMLQETFANFDFTNTWEFKENNHYLYPTLITAPYFNTDHTYDNALDTECNECGFIRSLPYDSYGTTGECFWYLIDGVLTISGNGEMGNYSSSSQVPWGTDIWEVIINNGVTTVGSCAFENCKNITTITIPSSVTTIGNYAFSGCQQLSRIDIPNSVTTIGNYAFEDCRNITTIDIPNSVTTIGNYAFFRCWNLVSITIPNSVITIGNYAFYGCTGLTSVSIPDNVTNIGNDAFLNCDALMFVTIGKSVNTIGENPFSGCNNLETLVVSKENHLYHSAGNCLIETESKTLVSGFKNSVIPVDGSVLIIGDSAFSNCTALTSITIPDNVTTLGNSAFFGCSSLESVIIPDSVTSIGNNAFNCCSNLTSVTIGKGITNISLAAFAHCSSLTSVTIPAGITQIGVSAFSGCSSLASIVIPDSVTSIQMDSFSSCSSLKNVYYTGTQETTKEMFFGTNNKNLTSATWHYNYCAKNTESYTHIYDNACDTDCNICKHMRTITHTYDNACDVDCSICKFIRVPPHSYDNSSALKCNLCGINRPTAPTVFSVTDTIVTLTFIAGMEYSIDGGETWQKSNVFDGLLPNTSYTFYQRIGETALLNASDKSVGTRVTTNKSLQTLIPQSPVAENVTKTSITLVSVEGCEYSLGGMNWQSSPTFTGLTEATSYTFYQRYKATASHYAGEKSVGATLCTQKGVQTAPKAPAAEKVTHNSVTLVSFAGVEYSLDGETWQTEATFRGLNPNTTYTFYQRLAETEKLYASPASAALTVTTPGPPPYTPGDVDGKEGVDFDDAIYLLYHVNFPTTYPVNQPVDFNGDGKEDLDDAIYLLYHVNFPATYPLH